MKFKVFLFNAFDFFSFKSTNKAFKFFVFFFSIIIILKNKKNYQKLQDKGGLEEVDDDKKVKEGVILSHYGQDNNLNEFITLFIKHVDKNLNKLFPKDIDANFLFISLTVLENFRIY